jgi:predicted DCC family thiol-disulfide oxidoreductase YuxK
MPNLKVLYDGQCLFCQKAISAVKSLDWLRMIEAADVFSLSDEDIQKLGLTIDRKTLREEIHALTPRGKVSKGFFAFRHIAKYIPLTWFLLPLFWFPGSSWLGPKIYRRIARNRYNICRFCKK